LTGQSNELRSKEPGPGELRRWAYAVWVVLIGIFAVLHALHLSADFPNGSPWVFDWAKYTDEGWYGNAAVRAHLFGNWYVSGDFNPATAVPVWPFAEWLLFFFTGVTIEAARALAVGCFFCSLILSYLLLRPRGPRWMALLGVSLIVTSPFLYCFTRLAILEPLQIALTLVALNLAVRLPNMRRPIAGAALIGVVYALMTLTKTTALFLFPAVVCAILLALWSQRRLAVRCALAAASSAALSYGLWIALIASRGLMTDYRYYFFVNDYAKPPEWYWRLVSLWWSFHGLLWVDHSLVPLAGVLVLVAALAWHSAWARSLWIDPVFGFSLCTAAGYVLFMTLQNHPQPRYFALPAVFCFLVVALAIARLLEQRGGARYLGWIALAVSAITVGLHGNQTIGYAAHPEYTYVRATTQLAEYIDAHPNGRRLLVSISGDQITLMTHVPSLCDDFGTEDLAPKLARYQPGWYAAWNDIDAGTLNDLHMHFSLEQAASFPALDDRDRNVLVLFKLHPLPNGQERAPDQPGMNDVLPDDKIAIPID
jgi:hypothetical protein